MCKLSIIRDEEVVVRSSSNSGCINDCDVELLILLFAPADLERLELDSTLPMLPNILMDVEEDLRLLLAVVPPLPLLLIGEDSEVVSAEAVGGDGDRHFILA